MKRQKYALVEVIDGLTVIGHTGTKAECADMGKRFLRDNDYDQMDPHLYAEFNESLASDNGRL